MKKMWFFALILVLFLAFAVSESDSALTTKNSAKVNTANTGVAAGSSAKVGQVNAQLRNEVRMELREGILNSKEEYKENIERIRETYNDDMLRTREEISVLLEGLKKSDLTEEEKEELTQELMQLRDERAELRAEYQSEVASVRAEYAEEVKELMLDSTGELKKRKLENGREVEVKVMPDVAAERAIERLRLKVCNETNNCSVEFKEVGDGNQTRLAYAVKATRRAKFLGFLWGKDIEVESEVDVETGEVIGVKSSSGLFF